VVCILSGGNNDIERMPDIKERSLIYEGLKHYFIIKFPQRSGALKQFVNKVLVKMMTSRCLNIPRRTARKAGRH
jgi:threonine dehydratase